MKKILMILFLSCIVSAQSWDQIIKIVASDRSENDGFGNSVAISGDYAIIGARTESEDPSGENTLIAAGTAYILYNNGGTWEEVQKIAASDREGYEMFGFSVSMSGNYAIIGAIYDDEDVSGENYLFHAGSAYIFHNNEGTWEEVQKIVASDRGEGSRFGISVSISGDYAIVGADCQDASMENSAGSAYIFHNNDGIWEEVQKIEASDRGTNDQFGISVSISGDYAIVGAAYESEDASGANTMSLSGSAYIFHNNGGTWEEAQKIVASDRGEEDLFGFSVSISGNYAIVGALNESEDATGGNTISLTGSAYIYHNDGGIWKETQKVVASDRSEYDNFGRRVSISEGYAIVGAENESEDISGENTLMRAGSAYIFSFNKGKWEEAQKIVASDRGVGSYFGNSVAISGDYAIVGANYEKRDASGGNTLEAAGSAYVFYNPTATVAAPSAGDGTPENPYLISNLKNLYWVSSDTANWTKHYKQINDIDASGSKAFGWKTIGDSSNHFSGSYNGSGHIIDELQIDLPDSNYVGFFGVTSGVTIDSLSITNSTISGYNFVGGLVGYNSSSTINACSFSGRITANNSVGGIAGSNNFSNLLNVYSSGIITGNTYVGGITGFLLNESLIDKSYSVAEISGTTYVGGLVGLHYTASNPSATNNSFWDKEVSGQSSSGGGTGLSTAEMKNPSTYINAEWDYKLWYMNPDFNNGYPCFSWQNPEGMTLPVKIATAPEYGDGSLENPYQIENIENLYWLSQRDINVSFGEYYIQTNNIDARITNGWNEGRGWEPIGGDIGFNGNYNGKGYKIENLVLIDSGKMFCGLFGYLVQSQIDSVIISNSIIHGLVFVGGLIGQSSNSQISNCSFSGEVKGYDDYTGGLVGISQTLSEISGCYTSGTVIGETNVGGLVGRNTSDAIIMNSYSRANVTVNDSIGGGLAGENDHGSLIINCYSTGEVYGVIECGGLIGKGLDSSAVNSFWDVESCGIITSGGGSGISSSEMKVPGTFITAGWADSLWCLDAFMNDGYPYLYWQNESGSPLPVEFTDNKLPENFILFQNYPNPFNPTTTIKYSIPNVGARSIVPVQLKVFNLLGEEVATLVNKQQAAGNYEVKFDGSNLASGIYLYKLNAGDFSSVKKLLLLK